MTFGLMADRDVLSLSVLFEGSYVHGLSRALLLVFSPRGPANIAERGGPTITLSAEGLLEKSSDIFLTPP